MRAHSLVERWALVAWASAAIGFEVGIARFTYGATLPFAQAYFGFSFTVGGVIGGLHLVGYLAGTLASPALVREFELLPVSRYAHVGFLASLIGCGMADSTWSFAGVRAALGVCAGICVSTVVVIVMNEVAAEVRDRLSAVLWSGPGIAIVVMGAALPVYSLTPTAWRIAWLGAAILAVGLLMAFPDRSGSRRAPKAWRAAEGSHVASSHTWIVAAYFLFGFAYLSFATFLSSRLFAAGVSLAGIASVWVAFGLAAIASGGLGLHLVSSTRSRRHALASSLLVGAAGALVAFDDTMMALVTGALLVGLGIAATPAIVTARIRERTTDEGYLSAFSVATAGTALGQILGPAFSGLLADACGPAAVPLFSAAVYGLGAAAALVDTARS